MKHNISLDFAVLSTLISIFLFTCGYIYLDSYTYFWGFNQSTLGFTFQDYLIHGGANNLLSLLIIFVVFIFFSLYNALKEKDLYGSFHKAILGFTIGIFIFIYEVFVKFVLKFIFFNLSFLKKIILNFKPTMLFFALIGKNLIALTKFILRKSEPIIRDVVEKNKKAVNWEDKDESRLEAAQKDFMSHYYYLVIFYLIFIFILFYIINEGKNGKNEAIKHFNNTGNKQIILKNELLNDWLETKNLKIHYPVNAKVLLCGSNKCLVAIPNINIKNPQNYSIPTLNNYLIMTIDPSNYIILK